MSQNGLIEEASAEIVIKVPMNLILVILNALQPEAETPSSDRSVTEVREKDGDIIITSRASDTTALRASLNSYLRWIQGILNMFNTLN